MELSIVLSEKNEKFIILNPLYKTILVSGFMYILKKRHMRRGRARYKTQYMRNFYVVILTSTESI